MTFAGEVHLKFKNSPLWRVILARWSSAFFYSRLGQLWDRWGALLRARRRGKPARVH